MQPDRKESTIQPINWLAPDRVPIFSPGERVCDLQEVRDVSFPGLFSPTPLKRAAVPVAAGEGS